MDTFIWWAGAIAISLIVIGAFSALSVLTVNYFLRAAENWGYFVNYIRWSMKYKSRNPGDWGSFPVINTPSGEEEEDGYDLYRIEYVFRDQNAVPNPVLDSLLSDPAPSAMGDVVFEVVDHMDGERFYNTGCPYLEEGSWTPPFPNEKGNSQIYGLVESFSQTHLGDTMIDEYGPIIEVRINRA